MNNIDKELLEVISDTSEYKGAYNIRKNGKGIERKITENIISPNIPKVKYFDVSAAFDSFKAL